MWWLLRLNVAGVSHWLNPPTRGTPTPRSPEQSRPWHPSTTITRAVLPKALQHQDYPSRLAQSTPAPRSPEQSRPRHSSTRITRAVLLKARSPKQSCPKHSSTKITRAVLPKALQHQDYPSRLAQSTLAPRSPRQSRPIDGSNELFWPVATVRARRHRGREKGGATVVGVFPCVFLVNFR